MYRNQLKDIFKLNITNNTRIKLEDPTPYIFVESEIPSDPPVQTVNCRIIDKTMLEKRQNVLNHLNRPYHPLLYTTFEKTQ